MPPRRTEITAEFPGAKYPVGSRVQFRISSEATLTGQVIGLRVKSADLMVAGGERWEVPYQAIVDVDTTFEPEMSLQDVQKLADRLLASHKKHSGLARAWQCGFDLAPARAGVCNYTVQRINLSVSYCQRADRGEIEDTILHEIAHAIVGRRHNHDAVWKAKAQEIGCTGERCHRVEHSVARWVGECGCGQQWFRHRLQHRMLKDRACAKCRGVITWRRNTELAE